MHHPWSSQKRPSASHPTLTFFPHLLPQATPGVATKADHYLGGELRKLTSAFEAAAEKHDNKSAALRAVAQEVAAVAAANLPFVSSLYLDGVLPLAAAVPAGGPSRFYAAHLTAQTAIHYGHLLAFSKLSAAALAWGAGDAAATSAGVAAALAAVDDMRSTLRAAEGDGTWSGSYAADGWTWIWGSRACIAHLQATLAGKVFPSIPSSPYPDYAFMTYETAHANDPVATPTFPFSTFNASLAWDIVPRFACAGDIPSSAAAVGASDCSSTWVGVTLKAGAAAEVGFFTAAYTGSGARAPHSVRYTTDGSPVTAASTKYTAPFSVRAPATVRARSFDDATDAPLGVESAADVSEA